MAIKTVKNGTTSINYYFETVVKPAVQADVSRSICFYYEGNQVMTYPAVLIHHQSIGVVSNYQKKNLFTLTIHVNKSQDMIAWEIIDSILNLNAFRQDNVSQFKFIPLYNWDDKNNPVQYGCIRLVINEEEGFKYHDDIDRNVRIYRLDIDAYYV